MVLAKIILCRKEALLSIRDERIKIWLLADVFGQLLVRFVSGRLLV